MAYLPRFSLTTNGYVISDRMIETIRSYDFSVTISLDGPKEIHDRLRVDKDDLGTWDAVDRNIKAITEMGIVPEFECTYTNEHYRSGIDLVTLMDYFYDNYQCNTLHCPVVIAHDNSNYYIPLDTVEDLYKQAIKYSVQNLAQGIPNSISMVTRLLNSLSTKTKICHYCPAGNSTFTVSGNGNIYACFMLMEGAGCGVGNVNKAESGLSYNDTIIELINNADKDQNQACKNCWCQAICFGCLGEDIARSKQTIKRSAIPGQSDLCDHKRSIYEAFLMSTAETYLR